MHFGAFTYAYSTNLGDEIQTLSASQYLPRVDTLIERDRLHWYRNRPPVFVIFNGWFTDPASWPPPDSIRPLFVAFHAAMPESLIDKKVVGYFKRHEPIGCRSMATLKAFREIGVDAYFSACLTLTLKRAQVERTEEILAVDVDRDLYTKLVPADIRSKTHHLTHEFPSADASFLTKAKWGSAGSGLRAICKWEWIRSTLAGSSERLGRARHSTRLLLARQLLARYSAAKLVITSRLHCAMPCLALGTPVLLLRPDIEPDPRFSGLSELVRYHGDASRPIKINWRNPEPNPDTYLKYATALRERCEGEVARALKQEGAASGALCGAIA